MAGWPLNSIYVGNFADDTSARAFSRGLVAAAAQLSPPTSKMLQTSIFRYYSRKVRAAEAYIHRSLHFTIKAGARARWSGSPRSPYASASRAPYIPFLIELNTALLSTVRLVFLGGREITRLLPLPRARNTKTIFALSNGFNFSACVYIVYIAGSDGPRAKCAFIRSCYVVAQFRQRDQVTSLQLFCIYEPC